MYEHVRQYVLVDYTAEKPCTMDDNIHDIHDIRPGGDDNDVSQISTKLMRDIRSMSDRQQLLMGAVVGFVSGYILTKTGKFVCIGVGAGVIVLQLATQNDYIKFNLLRTLSQNEMRSGNDPNRGGRVRSMLSGFFRKLHAFLVDQPNLTSGVIGGFLIGLGFS